MKHDVSPPLKAIPLPSSAPAASRAFPLHPSSLVEKAAILEQADAAVQEDVTAAIPTIPGMNLLGLGNGFVGPGGAFTVHYAPPDTNASVGTAQVVEVVNLQYAVFSKATGTPTLGPAGLETLFTGFGGGCSTQNLSDPVVLFDKKARRWVFEFFTVSTPYTFCIAVSTTADATGTYNRYSFPSTAGLPDYTKVGVWPDAYYLSTRLFRNGSTYIGPKACAVPRVAMLRGATATMQCFQVSDSTIDGMLPSDLDGTALPPSGSPNYFLVQGPVGSNTLQLYKFHVDFATPANSTFTGPTSLPVAAYTQAPFSSFVPQSTTNQKLDALGGFLMHRLAYRNFGTYESLLATHSVRVGSTSAKIRAGVRWYELRGLSTIPVVFQQGTYAPDLNYRWMGSIAQDKVGNIAVGYSVSSTKIFPQIRYTGRVPGDAPGTLEAEATIFTSGGAQTQLSRWGDYSSMSVDPLDDCTMWYSTEYIPTTGSFNWSTRLFSFKFPTCQ